MKIKSLLLGLALVGGLSMAAATHESTDKFFFGDEEGNAIESLEMTVGEETPILLFLDDNHTYRDFQAYLWAPDGVEFVKQLNADEDEVWCIVGDRCKSGYGIAAEMQDNDEKPEVKGSMGMLGSRMGDGGGFKANKALPIAKFMVKATKELAAEAKFELTKVQFVDPESGDGYLFADQAVAAATSIKNINGNKAISSVKYMNVAGMVSDRPFDGVNIIVTNYADGSKKVEKVIK